jgi:hypothetical protein
MGRMVYKIFLKHGRSLERKHRVIVTCPWHWANTILAITKVDNVR